MIKRYCDICGKEIIKNYPMCILSETTDLRGRIGEEDNDK